MAENDGKDYVHQRLRLRYCLYLVGFLDLFGVSLLMPLVAHHARELGASPTTIGAITSIYGTLQLFTGPIVGRWSDVAGKRFVLLFCLFMTAVSYFLKSISTTLFLLILPRIPLGLFKHGMAMNKALLAENTPKEDRAKVFGQYNSCATTGFIVGPLIGGYLSEYEGGFYMVASITASIFLLNYIIVFLFVHPPKKATTLPETKSVASFTTDEFSMKIKDFVQSFRLILHTCFDIFTVRFLVAFAIIIYRSNFSLMVEQAFEVTPKTIGQIISYGSVVSSLAGMCTGRIVKFYGDEKRLLLHSSIAQVLILVGLTFSLNLTMFVFFMTCLSIQDSVSRVCITDMSVRRSSKDTGALLGLSASLKSMARAMAPFIAGLSQEISYRGPGVIGITSAIIGCVCIVTILKDDTDGHDARGKAGAQEKDA